MRKGAKKRTRAFGTAVRRTGRATTRSTAGPGFTFEDQIAAWLLLKMLTGEAMPGMDGRLGVQLQSQTSALGWLIDDLLVTCGPESEESHLALSCKSNLQVTRAGLPHDFVSAAWKQFARGGTGPLRPDRDRIALVTRGHHPAFQAVWADIKNACTSSDPALAMARILSTGKHLIVFDNIKKVIQQSSATVRDEDVLGFVRRLLVVPTEGRSCVAGSDSTTTRTFPPDGICSEQAGTQQSRLELLKRLLDFELRPHADRREDDRDEPPDRIGYEIVPAIAEVIPGLPLDAAGELWQPLFRLGGNAHYILGHFIDCWLQQISRNCNIAAFSRHWKAMRVRISLPTMEFWSPVVLRRTAAVSLAGVRFRIVAGSSYGAADDGSGSEGSVRNLGR